MREVNHSLAAQSWGLAGFMMADDIGAKREADNVLIDMRRASYPRLVTLAVVGAPNVHFAATIRI